jgi:membrane-bound lytic murein transglycosylase A
MIGFRVTPVRTLVHGLIIVVALALAACEVQPPKPPAPPHVVYRQVAFADIPGWRDDAQDAAWPAFRVGCKALVARAATRAVWEPACRDAEALEAPDTATARAFFESHFTAWRVADSEGHDTGLVTGYYEPLLHGARDRSAAHPVPLYGRPDDLLVVDLADLFPELRGKRVRGRLDGRRVVPYWTRADIDEGRGALDGRALAFVRDPIEAFFLEVQGSGRIALDDGGVMRLGYADQNGQPYRSIAGVLIDAGEMTRDTASKQAIEAWGRAHPDRVRWLLEQNPSYVFFREIPPPPPGSLEARIDGPIGALGVPLLGGRTVAVDRHVVPLGAPVFLDTTSPLDGATLQRLTLAQDTGGAIRGIGRIDYFWGFGDAAGEAAGRMRQQGATWLLWPRGMPLPQAEAGG